LIGSPTARLTTGEASVFALEAQCHDICGAVQDTADAARFAVGTPAGGAE
jgi:hypothetical protein